MKDCGFHGSLLVRGPQPRTIRVVFAEIVPVIVPLLANLLQSGSSAERDSVAYFATQSRAESSMARFLDAAAAAGLHVEEVGAAPDVVFHHLNTEEDADGILLHRITLG